MADSTTGNRYARQCVANKPPGSWIMPTWIFWVATMMLLWEEIRRGLS